MNPWDILEIPATRDKALIRKAYSKKLKAIDQVNDIEGFQRLREAYQAAKSWEGDADSFADSQSQNIRNFLRVLSVEDESRESQETQETHGDSAPTTLESDLSTRSEDEAPPVPQQETSPTSPPTKKIVFTIRQESWLNRARRKALKAALKENYGDAAISLFREWEDDWPPFFDRHALEKDVIKLLSTGDSRPPVAFLQFMLKEFEILNDVRTAPNYNYHVNYWLSLVHDFKLWRSLVNQSGKSNLDQKLLEISDSKERKTYIRKHLKAVRGFYFNLKDHPRRDQLIEAFYGRDHYDSDLAFLTSFPTPFVLPNLVTIFLVPLFGLGVIDIIFQPRKDLIPWILVAMFAVTALSRWVLHNLQLLMIHHHRTEPLRIKIRGSQATITIMSCGGSLALFLSGWFFPHDFIHLTNIFAVILLIIGVGWDRFRYWYIGAALSFLINAKQLHQLLPNQEAVFSLMYPLTILMGLITTPMLSITSASRFYESLKPKLGSTLPATLFFLLTAFSLKLLLPVFMAD
ncbi:MAG: hypothetical protein HRU19_27775 [Pseudobacteriovorax sp.]|nr:hypothetical protein [Pseudobacteriovorax sp.]